MKTRFTIEGKNFVLKPYTTRMEKELLIYSAGEDQNIDEIFWILDECIEGDFESLSDLSKKCLLMKLRSISVGETVTVRYQCPHCKRPDETQINIENSIPKFKTSKFNEYEFKTIPHLNPDEENIHLFFGLSEDDLDKLTLKEFGDLLEYATSNNDTIKFESFVDCTYCKGKVRIEYNDLEKMIQYMSDDTILNLYNTYNELVYNGRYSKADIDDMLPFEREIFVNMLNKKLKELAETRQSYK